MSFQEVVIRHSGQWDRAEYVGGDEVVVYMSKEELFHSNLMREVHEQLDEDGRSTYMLFYTSTTDEGRKIKVALKADSDLNRLISEQKQYPVVYVIEKGKQSAATVPQNQAGYYESQRSTVLPTETDAALQAEMDIVDTAVANGNFTPLVAAGQAPGPRQLYDFGGRGPGG